LAPKTLGPINSSSISFLNELGGRRLIDVSEDSIKYVSFPASLSGGPTLQFDSLQWQLLSRCHHPSLAFVFSPGIFVTGGIKNYKKKLLLYQVQNGKTFYRF